MSKNNQAGPPKGSNNVNMALILSREGFSVFPCFEADEGNHKAKSPRVKWREASTTNGDAITRWWSAWPNAAIGLDLGKSGLLVIDADRHDVEADGVAAFGEIMSDNGFDPDSAPIVATPNNGCHYYFRLGEGQDHGNGEGDLPDGINVRGNGGYVIAPATNMGDGTFYEAFGDIRNAPLIPDWLWKRLKANKVVSDMPDTGNVEACPAPKTLAKPSVEPSPDKTGHVVERDVSGNQLSGASMGELEELLFEIPPDCGYDEWHRCLMAVHSETGGSEAGFNLVDRWSAGGDKKYEGSAKLRKKWATFKGGGVNRQSLAVMAKRYGADLTAIALKHNQIGPDQSQIEKSVEIAKRLYAQEIEKRGKKLELLKQEACSGIVHIGCPLEFQYEPELIRDLVPQVGVGFIGGQSGAGKTFLGIDLMHRIATGEAFAGHSIDRKGGVLFVAFEGAGTIHNRVFGWQKRLSDKSFSLPIYMDTAPKHLDNEAGFQYLLNAAREADRLSQENSGVPLVAIIIDTVTASGGILPDKENDASSWQKYMDALQFVSKELRCAILLVHHYGKAADAGLRGSSGARAAADFTLAMTCERDEITGTTSNRQLAITKSRNGHEGPIGAVEMTSVTIGKRDDGSDITTLVVDISKQKKRDEKPSKLSDGMKTLVAAFTHVRLSKGQKDHAMGRPENPMVEIISIDDLRDEFNTRHASGDGDPEKRKEAARKAFSRQIKAAQNHGFTVATFDGQEWIWRSKNEL